MTPETALKMCSELVRSGTLDWWTKDTLEGFRDQVRDTGVVTEHQEEVITAQWDRHGLLKGGR